MQHRLGYFGIAALVAAFISLSFSSGLFVGLENFFEDILFSSKTIQRDIVILAIDNVSIEKIGQWPWPREIFARAFERMNQFPPRAVAFDVILSEPSRLGADDDGALAAALSRVTFPIIFPFEATSLITETDKPSQAGNVLKPLALFTDKKTVTLGHVNLIIDRDGVVRTFPLAVMPPSGGEPTPAFALETVRRSGYSVPNESSLDAVVRIAYSAPTGTMRRLPFARILDDSGLKELSGKLVFIGATAADLHDEKPTPLGRGTEMPGVEIQANIANMLLSGYRVTPIGRNFLYIWIAVAAFLPVAFFLLMRRTWQSVATNVFVGGAHLAMVVFLFDRGLAANMIHINFAWVLSTVALFGYRHFAVERDEREIRGVFSKYVSGRVLETIMKNPRGVALGGEEREITVLFSDIRGFTTLSERMTPRELVRILNRYFTAMTEEIMEQCGVLDKYIGDAIMAFWGAPLDEPEQADLAVSAAAGMIRRLNTLNAELRAAGDPEIKIGIGIATGRAVAGNVGSELRFNYTAIGDVVNVASRLEGLNKEYHTRIIIADGTRQKLKKSFPLVSLGAVSVKGRQESVQIYALKAGV